jgi:hypothetical protein
MASPRYVRGRGALTRIGFTHVVLVRCAQHDNRRVCLHMAQMRSADMREQCRLTVELQT